MRFDICDHRQTLIAPNCGNPSDLWPTILLDFSSQHDVLKVDGSSLSIEQTARVAQGYLRPEADKSLPAKLQKAVDLVDQAVEENQEVYGVTTGFGGMAGIAITPSDAAASQNNLLSFLATGAGDPLDPRHTRAAMLLRANVLAQGRSGVRFEIVDRLLNLLAADAIPVVRELGSIGASGDLVPLSTIARAITGNNRVKVQCGADELSGNEALKQLELTPLKLRPKEGLALVNGTSFSAAIAANTVFETRQLLALTFGAQALMLQALQVQLEPFEPFVHASKPHPGQLWAAGTMRELLHGGHHSDSHGDVQDRYSLRCLPQYLGGAVEGIARAGHTVETEMNSVSDNPLIDVDQQRFYQSGNFLGQYVGLAMDDIRRHIGLMAKHLDIQIASLVAPEFSKGLPASLRGNKSVDYNMGLKGLQITGNSIMPMLTWAANPLVEHYPTHAEQFNQNINGLSWGAAQLAWRSVELYRHYISVALIFGVQALDLRAQMELKHCDGRELLSPTLAPLYESVCDAISVQPTQAKPLLLDDADQWIEQQLEDLTAGIASGELAAAVEPVSQSFLREFPAPE